MAQDEYFLNSSNSGGSGSGGGHGGGGGGEGSNSNNDNNKSRNKKKVPQRGLGVAQLERLRLEEQRNRNREALQVHDPPQPPTFGPVQAVNALINNAIGLAHDPPHSPNFIPDHMIPALAPAPVNATNLYRPVAGPPTNVPSWLWSGEFNNNNVDGGEDDKQRVDHHHDVGFTFGQQINLNLQYEPNGPGLPVSEDGHQGSFQFQRPASSSVTAVGMKRAYPFNLESPPAPMPSFLSNFHASGSRSDGFRSWSNEHGNKSIGDGHLVITPSPEQNPVPVEDTKLMGDFLTLAPPVAASTPLSMKNKHPLDLGRQGLDLSDNRSLSSQENLRSRQANRIGPSASTNQSFSFFPVKLQMDQMRAHVRNARDNEEKEEKLDLNLKL